MKAEIKKLLQELQKKELPIKIAKDVLTENKTKTGVFALDWVIDRGLGNKHRIEFWGKESSGKTTFALKLIKRYQELDKITILMDAEHSFDAIWAEKLGVDTENLIVMNPESLEEMGDTLYSLIPKVDLIVVDSIVSLIPQGELDRDISETQVALGARVNSLICRKVNSAFAKSDCCLVFINQLREKIGSYGNPYISAGGHALLHLYDTRIEFKLGKPIDKEKERIGYELNLKCIKNKKGRPYRNAQIDFYFNGYVDNKKSLFFAGLKFNVIGREGNTYSFGDKKAVGKDKFMESLTDEDWKAVEDKIWEVAK